MTRSRLKVGVLVASKGRPADLANLLASVKEQSLQPDSVVLSVTAEDDLPMPLTEAEAWYTVVMGPPGLPAQRNRAVDAAPDGLDLWAFLDDDLISGRHFLAEMVKAFEDAPGIVGANGLLLANGAESSARISPEAAIAQLWNAEPTHGQVPISSLYGCNMVVRSSAAQEIRFDEDLPLYGYLEDRDYSVQLGRRGQLVRVRGAQAVHLGSTTSRIGARSFGYAQVANVVHLTRKGTYGGRLEGAKSIAFPVAKNLVKALGGPQSDIRRRRAAGNLIAFKDWTTRRIHPSRMVGLG